MPPGVVVSGIDPIFYSFGTERYFERTRDRKLEDCKRQPQMLCDNTGAKEERVDQARNNIQKCFT